MCIRDSLYVDPSSYAQIGGWTFDKEGQKIQLNFYTCYPMGKGTTSEKSPVRIGRAREDTCPHCGGRMVDILVLDGRDERLRFLDVYKRQVGSPPTDRGRCSSTGICSF